MSVASIIVLSGPVGAGKSALARELVALSSGPTACIEGDKFWSFIARAPEERDEGQRFRTLMRSMTLAALPFARAGYETIIDFSMPPAFLEYVRAAAKEIPLHYVVLLPSLAVCTARAASRREGAVADYARYRQLYALFDPNASHTIRDDESAPTVLAARVHQGLEGGIFRVT